MFLPPAVMIRSFLPVGDLEVAGLVELAHVAGVQPAVLVQRGRRGRRVLEVADEVGGRPGEHLAVAGDLDLDARQGDADLADAHLVVRGERGQRRVLGLPVALTDSDAERPEVLQHLRGDRRRAGDRDAHPSQAQLVSQAPVDAEVAELRDEPVDQSHPSVHPAGGEVFASPQPEPVGLALQPARRRPCGSRWRPASSPTREERRGTGWAGRPADRRRTTRRPCRSSRRSRC